jgi:hypothetical protein
VTLRKVPGAVVLGLLASLAAHAVVFGSEHAVGGSYHTLLVQAAVGGAVALIAFFGALAWSGSGLAADGSVLAARLRERLPGFGPIFTAAMAWFAAAEAVEPHHAGVMPVAIVAALAIAAALASRLAGAVADALAQAAIALSRSPFAPRAPVYRRRARTQPLYRRAGSTRRRFARPPPIGDWLRA